MGKIVVVFLSVFLLTAVVVKFKGFKSSLVELSAALNFVHFHHQQPLIVNGSSGEPGEPGTTTTTTRTAESPTTRSQEPPVEGKLSFHSIPNSNFKISTPVRRCRDSTA